MRRLLSFFSMLVAVATLAWAGEVTFDLTTGTDATAWEGATSGGVTLTPGQGGNASLVPIYYANGAAVRFYKDNTLTVSASNAITSIVINGSTTTNFVPQSGTVTSATGKITWTGEATSVVFDISAACRAKTIVVTVDEGGDTPQPVTVAAPTFSPAAGEVESGTQVTLSQPDAALIMYTLDGSDPSYANEVGNPYEGAITVTEAVTIKAIAVDNDGNESAVASAAYTIKADTPDDPVVVTTGVKFRRINSAADLKAGSTYIVVCEDNSSAWYNTRTQGTDGIKISDGVATLDKENANFSKFKQFALGGAADAYTLTDGENYVQWTTSTTLGLTTMPEDAAKAQWKISFDGNNAVLENVSSARKIFGYQATDFRAYAAANDNSHNVQLYILDESAEPVAEVADPVFSPDGGTYNEAVSVTITSATAGADIYYTITDDYNFPAVPTEASTKYEGPIELKTSGYYWLHAIAIKDGVKSSPVQNYYLLEINDQPAVSKAEAPVITPAGGAFSGEQRVTISANGEVDMILYTTDGQDPSFELGIGTDYDESGAFTITKSTVVKAIALDPDAVPTEVVTAEFTLNPAGAPVFSPESGTTFEETLNVKIAADNAAMIMYTTDGTAPSYANSVGELYDDAAGIDLTATTTIKAIAVNNDGVETEVVEATYTKQGDEPQPGQGDFARINNVADLEVGAEYLIVNEANGASIYNSASQTTEITLANGTASLPEGSDVNVYTLGGQTGAYTLVSNEKYLQYSGSGTGISWKAMPEDATLAQWDITFDGNNVVLKNVKSSRVVYAYNSGNNNEFRLYTTPNTSCTVVQLYKKGAETPVDPTVVGVPTIDPESKEFTEAFEATITAGENGVAIAYALNDGEEVVVEATTATVAIPAETTTLVAFSVAEDGTRSEAATATYTFKKDEPIGEGDFARINKAADLEIGAEFIIVSEDKSASIKNSATQSTMLTIADGAATLAEGSDVNVYTLGGEEGAYTLVSNEKYLQYSGSGTGISWKEMPEDATLAQWSITFDGNDAVLTNVKSGRQIYAYQDRDFRLYTSTGSNEVYPIQLYKKGTGEEPGLKGDVNQDGQVNAGDVSELYAIILGTDTTNEKNADLNGDGNINAGDVSELYSIILAGRE